MTRGVLENELKSFGGGLLRFFFYRQAITSR